MTVLQETARGDRAARSRRAQSDIDMIGLDGLNRSNFTKILDIARNV